MTYKNDPTKITKHIYIYKLYNICNIWSLHIIKCYASKHKTYVQHLHNAGPTSKTLGRRRTNATQLLRVCFDVLYMVYLHNVPYHAYVLCEIIFILCYQANPVNTKHLNNIYTTSAQRLRVAPALYKWLTNHLCRYGAV